jgi:apolipoprotein N-acyltransferase
MKKIMIKANFKNYLPKLTLIFCAFLSAILLVLSFPKFDLEIFAWIAFIPLLISIRDLSPKRAFIWGFISGAIFFLGILYWLLFIDFIKYFLVPAVFVLIIYLGLYWGIFSLFFNSYFRLCHNRNINRWIFYISSAGFFIFLEWVRGHVFTGFPWALLGYSQYKNIMFIQIASVTGVYGVSFLLILVNIVVADTIYRYLIKLHPVNCKVEPSPISFSKADGSPQRGEERGGVSMIFDISILFVIISVVFLYGWCQVNRTKIIPSGNPIKVAVVQPNISQNIKWRPEFKDEILKINLSETKKIIKENPQIIIWPEVAYPGYVQDDVIYLKKIQNLLFDRRIDILIGTDWIEEGKVFNSAFYINNRNREMDKKKRIERYDKIHLVPFGEYLPGRRIISAFGIKFPLEDFSVGSEYKLLDKRFGALICFESIFPDLVRKFVNKGASFMVNITNDAWFGKTFAPYQHYSMLIYRAIENRKYFIRCANTGISGVIDPWGRQNNLKDKSGNLIFIKGAKVFRIIPNSYRTFYIKYGDLFPAIMILLSLFLNLIFNNRGWSRIIRG